MNRTLSNKDKSLKIASLLKWVPTRLYLKIIYKYKTGRKLNLKKPTKFTDKLNYLKIHNKNKNYTKYVDKLEARNIAKEIIGEKYLIPVLGKWENFDEIDFNSLPEAFVLKCNHDSGSTKIIRHKSELTENDYKALRKFFKSRLRANMYSFAREYPYKDIHSVIYAEKYMVDESGFELKDYKFFCFNGKPELYFIASNRGVDTRFDFYDMNNNHLDIYNTHKNADHPFVGKPYHFDEMVEITKKLSESFPFVRIDLYTTQSGVFFGEFTFFHCAGYYPFEPEMWEDKLGKLLKIS